MSGTVATLIGGATFRGVPFGVMASGGSVGRKVAVHDYPERDGVWVEDMGRAGRAYRFAGVLAGDTALVLLDALRVACEAEGPGPLTHPDIGYATVSCVRFGWDRATDDSYALEFEFLEQQSGLLATIVSIAAQAAIAVAVTTLETACGGDYASDTASAYDLGAPVVSATQDVASQWSSLAVAAAYGADVSASAPAALAGSYGRYAGTVADTGATVASLGAQITTAQLAVTTAAASLVAASTASALAAAAFGVAEAVRSTALSPLDQIAALSSLASFAPAVSTSTAPIGGAISTAQTAVAALLCRAAVASMALASASYQPTSYDDAVALRSQMAAVLRSQMIAAADAADDTTAQALRDLRALVIKDLTDRGAALPRLVTITRNASIAAPVLAQQLYQDGSRSDDLVARTNPIHPGFMPTSFQALAE